jgi:hypothetical protein
MSVYALWFMESDAEIVNNTVTSSGGAVGNAALQNRCVRAYGNQSLRFRNNIFQITYGGGWGGAIAFEADSGVKELLNCCIFATSGQHTYGSGYSPIQCLFQDPLLNDGSPSISSPCINAGLPEPAYRDRDGTRNDMGFTGGPLHQADGLTTDKPLLFWMMPEKAQVWKNVQPTLNVEAAATAGH